ncbi:hypothetical protein LX36DRAFT_532275, partial [Colletotrichum falcatum]
PAHDWVGTGNDGKGRDWHRFSAMVMIPDGTRGKNLLIYTNDANEGIRATSRISTALRGLARTAYPEA